MRTEADERRGRGEERTETEKCEKKGRKQNEGNNTESAWGALLKEGNEERQENKKTEVEEEKELRGKRQKEGTGQDPTRPLFILRLSPFNTQANHSTLAAASPASCRAVGRGGGGHGRSPGRTVGTPAQYSSGLQEPSRSWISNADIPDRGRRQQGFLRGLAHLHAWAAEERLQGVRRFKHLHASEGEEALQGVRRCGPLCTWAAEDQLQGRHLRATRPHCRNLPPKSQKCCGVKTVTSSHR